MKRIQLLTLIWVGLFTGYGVLSAAEPQGVDEKKLYKEFLNSHIEFAAKLSALDHYGLNYEKQLIEAHVVFAGQCSTFLTRKEATPRLRQHFLLYVEIYTEIAAIRKACFAGDHSRRQELLDLSLRKFNADAALNAAIYGLPMKILQK